MQPNNILSLQDMSYLIENFLKSSQKKLCIGEIAGCGLFQMVAQLSIGEDIPFRECIVVEGCQDVMGYIDEKLSNVVYWADLFMDNTVDYIEVSAFKRKPITMKSLNVSKYDGKTFMIVTDAHLIPRDALNHLESEFGGKIVEIVDPYDMFGENYTTVPTVTDSLYHLSLTTAYARRTYDVATNVVNTKLKSEILHMKHVSKRSIGKMDSYQYITNDGIFCEDIRIKQYQTPIRRHQKVVCSDERVNTRVDLTTLKAVSFPKYALGTIQTVPRQNLTQLRLWNTKLEYFGRFEYDGTEGIQVKPANIIMTYEACFHRFNKAVLIVSDSMTRRELYSMMKNCNSLTLGHV